MLLTVIVRVGLEPTITLAVSRCLCIGIVILVTDIMPSDEFRERVVRALEAVAQNSFVMCVLLITLFVILLLK